MSKTDTISSEQIEKSIYLIRGEKVMLDRDLAELYQVPTKALNQAVRRNLDRFPADFMFPLSHKEVAELNRSQFVTGSQKHRDPRRKDAIKSTSMRLRLIVSLVILTVLVVPTATSEASPSALQKKPGKPIFVFHTDEFWLNLHHFLYVLGRAQNKTTDSAREAVNKAPAEQEKGFATLTTAERNAWNEAISAYAVSFSKKDLVFDDPMPAIAKALAQAGEARTLTISEIDPAIVVTLQRAGPIYRKAWWPEHKRANQSWQTSIQKLVKQHGPTVLGFITHAYQESWPDAGYAVHLSAFANWAGAYSTEGNLLVVSTLAEDNRELYALETIFHEAMHQWDDQVSEALQTQARLQNKSAPRGLSHAMIFFTAGEAIRKVDAAHVPYAEKAGVWQRGLLQFKQPLEQIWKPYLDGKGTRDEALAQLIKATK